jgi:hypothetical protein
LLGVITANLHLRSIHATGAQFRRISRGERTSSGSNLNASVCYRVDHHFQPEFEIIELLSRAKERVH